MRQFPARPVEPVRGFVFAAREREAERRFAARGGDLRACAGLDQRLQQRHGDADVELDREMHRRDSRARRVRSDRRRARAVRARSRRRRARRRRAAPCVSASVGAAPVAAALDELERERAASARRSRRAASRASTRATDAGAADRRAARGEIGERRRARRQKIEQRIDETAAVAELRFTAEAVIQQPVARFAGRQLREREIEIGERRRRPFAHDVRELGDDVPVAEAERIEQMIGVRGFGRDDVAGQRARQRIRRIEQRDDVPAAGCGGVIERALAVGRRERAIGAEREQRAHGFLVRVARLARDDERAAAFGIDEIRIRLALAERVHDADGAGARGFHQRGGAAVIGEIRDRRRRRAALRRCACGRRARRSSARCAPSRRARSTPARCLSSAFTPRTSSSPTPAASSSAGCARDDFGFRAAIEQEIDDVPARVHAGDAERGQSFAIDRVDVGGCVDAAARRRSARRSARRDAARVLPSAPAMRGSAPFESSVITASGRP